MEANYFTKLWSFLPYIDMNQPRVYMCHICVKILYWCFSFWLTSLCIIGSSFIHLIRTDLNVFFFNSWVIFHCVYVPQLSYPFICRWASRLLPCPSYCKQCCDKHWGTHVSFNSGFLSVYAQQWHFRSYGSSISSF